MVDSVDSFLQLSREEGARDSEGAFTVDLQKSLRKLERFRLADRGAYLLKIVQAASCLDSGLVLVTIAYDKVEVSFSFFWDESVNAKNLGEGLTGQADWASPACRHLGLGLRAGLGAGHRKATWSLGPEHVLSLSPDGAECRSQAERGVVRATIEFERTSSLSSAADEHEVLYRKCRLSPTRVRVDTRPVEQGWVRRKRREAWHHRLSEPYTLMEGYAAPSKELPKFVFPGLDLRHSRRKGGIYRSKLLTPWGSGYRRRKQPGAQEIPTLFHHLQVKPPSTRKEKLLNWECGVAFLLELDLGGPSRIVFLIDGVMTEPLSVDLGCPGLLAVASAEGLATDISEFGLMQNSVYEARVKAVVAAAKQFLETATARQSEYLPMATDTLNWKPDRDAFLREVRQRMSRPGQQD